MKIAIISDTHSRYPVVEAVLRILQERKINHVLHCGDIDDSETVWLFQGVTSHFVLGNSDALERTSIRQAIHGIGAELHEPFGHLEIEGVRIAWLHGDDEQMLFDVEHADYFDFLFHGHTHQAAQHRTGRTLVVNPGALHRARVLSFAILDLSTRELETVVVDV